MPGQQPYDSNERRRDGQYDAYPSQGDIPPHEQRPRPVEVGEYNPVAQSDEGKPPIAGFSAPGTPPGIASPVTWPSRDASAAVGVIHNALPSKRFPDPSVLAKTPLSALFHSSLVAEPGETLLRAIGKVLIRLSNDSRQPPASGSAWLVSPSVIATSAHNLYDSTRRTWSASIDFCPGYDYYSSAPPITARATSCYIPKDYMANPTTDRDIGLCFLDRKVHLVWFKRRYTAFYRLRFDI